MSIDPDQYQGNVVDTTRRIRATGPGTPSDDVVDAFSDGLVHVLRRIEIYESDGETLWNPDIEGDEEFSRIIDGGVTIDYNADERRVLDLTLDNRDLLLSPDAFDGLWYDKIIKPFYGVSFVGGAVPPKVAIIDSTSEATAKQLRQVLSTIGYNEIDILLDVTTVDELRGYSVVFIYRTTAVSSKLELATQLWNQGVHVFTFGVGTDETNLPHYFSTVDSGGSVQWGISPTEGDSPVAGSFVSATAGNGAGRIPTATEIGVLPLAVYDVGPTTDAVTASLATSPSQGQWVDMHIVGFSATQTKNLLRAISHWIRGVGIPIEWETQIGEFMIDGLSYPHFPDQLKITGRDYVKKMKGSKLARASTFTAGTKLRDLIIALATNSGISANRMRVGISDSDVLTSDMTYDVGTERWQIAKEACTSFNYEIFFDAFGWLTVRKFIDPYLGPTAWVFKTGVDGGNLVSFDKTLNDSEIYNHIIVTATPAEGEEVMPHFGEAKNEDPSSPTRIQRLGQRVLPVEANYLNSDAECKALADALLKIHALEQYALNTLSIVYPWLEVGEIDEILDPEATPTEPTRYLMDNLTIPLTLSPMGGTGKRVTIVGQTGNPINTGGESEE